MKTIIPLVLAALSIQFHAPLPAAQAQPMPSWIWTSDKPADNERAYFHTSFQVRPGLLKAILLIAADHEATIYCNGKKIGVATGGDKAASIDITAAIAHGANTLALAAVNDTGPAGVIAVVELSRDDGRTQWLLSDDTWIASSKEEKGWNDAGFTAANWKPAINLGKVGTPAVKDLGNPFAGKTAVDAYNSWRLATGTGKATDPATMQAPPGFVVELVRSAAVGEDSWVSMAFDPQGRITVAKEKAGLLRFTLGKTALGEPTVDKVESINTQLLECRGLLYAHGALYANANNSKAFVRLRDTTPNDGNDAFDEVKSLLRTEGSTGHGRNHVVLGPDGSLYLVHGNDVRLPSTLSPRSPYQRFADDVLIPSDYDQRMDGTQEQTPGGHILRTDKDGSFFEVVAAGLRNPFDVAFNEDGEMFTFDADMELDLGCSWYRPNRVNHIISGAEFGWRKGTGKWPTYFADSLGSVCDIGLASPTGVEMGTKLAYPPKYQKAFFIADWAYGRILAVHMKPKGASYTGSYETFLAGRPLNVTDIRVGPDGALYVLTGGRQTQSGLYRVRYTGPKVEPAKPTDEEQAQAFAAEQARTTRTFDEQAHVKLDGAKAVAAVKTALGNLRSDDVHIRFAARVALEHQEPTLWQTRVFEEQGVDALLTGLIAVCRAGDKNLQARVLTALNALQWPQLTEAQQLAALRVYQLCLLRMGKPDAATSADILKALNPHFPAKSPLVNRELCRLLTYLGEPTIRPRTFAMIEQSSSSEDLIHYLFTIRSIKGQWDLTQLEAYFKGLNKAAHLHPGRNYAGLLKAIRTELATALPNEAKLRLQHVMVEPAPPTDAFIAEKPVFVRDWKMEDLAPSLGDAGKGRSYEKARAAYAKAQCSACHRLGPHVPQSEVGPDLTAVAARFPRRDLLEQIVNPSKVVDEKFKQSVITLADGQIITGQIALEDDQKIVVHPNPLAKDTITLSKKEVTARKLSDLSPMPAGLISVLSREEILDLIAYLESGGKADAPAFAK